MKPIPAQRRVSEGERVFSEYNLRRATDLSRPFRDGDFLVLSDTEVLSFRAILTRQWIELLPGRTNEYGLSDAGRKALEGNE